DPSIYVAFPFDDPDAVAKAFGQPTGEPGAVVIWTTTPWTIPANQALNVHPEFEYALVRLQTARETGDLLILAKDRVEACLTEWGLQGEVIALTSGENLAGLTFRHPLFDAHEGYRRVAPIYVGDYVTLDSGTGIVHSAPAYGVEDFISCKAHGLADDEIINPVKGDGYYADSLPLFGGHTIWKANPLITEALQLAGTLLKVETVKHSYMHCWRHKTPVIYRATSQWFAGMDRQPSDGEKTLRELALQAVEDTAFYPGWGKARLHAMIA